MERSRMEPNNSTQNTQYAGYFLRLLAALTEGALWFLIPSAVFVTSVQLAPNGLEGAGIALAVTMIYLVFVHTFLKLALHAWLTSRYGGDVGKIAVGLKIVKDENLPLTFKNALFRENIAKIASNGLLGLGYFWIIRDKKERQAWHDLLSNTHVLRVAGKSRVLVAVILLTGGLILNAFMLGSATIKLINKIDFKLLEKQVNIPALNTNGSPKDSTDTFDGSIDF